jgi:hypothetical protein
LEHTFLRSAFYQFAVFEDGPLTALPILVCILSFPFSIVGGRGAVRMSHRGGFGLASLVEMFGKACGDVVLEAWISRLSYSRGIPLSSRW